MFSFSVEFEKNNPLLWRHHYTPVMFLKNWGIFELKYQQGSSKIIGLTRDIEPFFIDNGLSVNGIIMSCIWESVFEIIGTALCYFSWIFQHERFHQIFGWRIFGCHFSHSGCRQLKIIGVTLINFEFNSSERYFRSLNIY